MEIYLFEIKKMQKIYLDYLLYFFWKDYSSDEEDKEIALSFYNILGDFKRIDENNNTMEKFSLVLLFDSLGWTHKEIGNVFNIHKQSFIKKCVMYLEAEGLYNMDIDEAKSKANYFLGNMLDNDNAVDRALSLLDNDNAVDGALSLKCKCNNAEESKS